MKYIIGHYSYLKSDKIYTTKLVELLDDLINNFGYQILFDTSEYLKGVNNRREAFTKFNLEKLDLGELIENKDVEVILYFNYYIGRFPLLTEIFNVPESLKKGPIKMVGYIEEVHLSPYHEKIVQYECEHFYDILISPSIPAVMSGKMKEKHVYLANFAPSNFTLNYNSRPKMKISISGKVNDYYKPRKILYELAKSNNFIDVLDHPYKTYNFDFNSKQHSIVGKEYAEYLNGYLCCFTSPAYVKRNDGVLIYPVAKHFEILASGSLLLTSNTIVSLLSKLGLFPGKHYLVYDDNKESIKNLISYVLDPENIELVNNIRKSGQEQVKRYHLSHNRAFFINSIINKILTENFIPDTELIFRDYKNYCIQYEDKESKSNDTKICEKVGIVGLGFVGESMKNSFELKGITTVCYDKFKNSNQVRKEDILFSEIVFLCLPTSFCYKTNQFEKSAIKEWCNYLSQERYPNPVVLKSTVEPETVLLLSKEYSNLKLFHNPEFLTARTAKSDFHNQSHIVLGKGPGICDNDVMKIYNFYKFYYPTAYISICSSTESESMKLFCNSFYASKVEIFTEYYLLCQKIGIEFEKVRDLMLKNDWINPMHTIIPGPDGSISYGGLCFPKDIRALDAYMKNKNSENGVLSAVIQERDRLRKD